MSAPVLTLTTASSPSSSQPHIANKPQAPEPQLPAIHTLASLSRNASVISSSSSSSSSSSVVAPIRPRPLRTFSNHSASTARARSPNNPRSPTTPTRGSIPAAYLPRSLSPEARLGAMSGPPTPAGSRPGSRHTSRPPNNRSRSNSSVHQQQKAISADDFDFGDILGSGSYSSVMIATYRNTGKAYAAKVIDKAHIVRHRKTKYATIEKTCLVRLGTGNLRGSGSSPKSPERNHQRKPSGLGGSGGHPGVIRMHWAFHDETSLYFVLDLAPNGELLTCIRRQGSLSYQLTKYYTAQLVDTLVYIHDMNILHRDVKPENVLLDAERRIKITDFGSAKLLDEDKSTPGEEQEQRASSFVGSGLYVSPELLTRSLAGKSSDVWALGSIIYYMIAGDAPFKSMSEYLTFEKIKKCDYTFPPDNSPAAFDPRAKDLIQHIFVLDTAERYTLDQIRAHPFLSSINFATLWTDPAPPLEPGTRKNLTPPLSSTVFDDDDEDAGGIWDQFVGTHVQQQDESDDDEEADDEELQRVSRMYGKGRAPAAAAAADMAFPAVHEADESVEEHQQERKHPQTPSPPARILSSVAEEPATPRPPSTTPVTSPKQQASNSGFVVLSRRRSSASHPTAAASSSSSKPLPPPPINSVVSIASTGPGSASSASSSEGSPVESAGVHMPSSSSQVHPLGLFTRVWGKAARRGSSSSVTASPNVAPAPASTSLGITSGLGLSVWSSAARRTSFGSTSGKRLSPDLRGGGMGSRSGSGSGLASRRMSNNSSTSRKGSRSGSMFGARADMGKWSGLFLPGEQVLFHTPIHSRTRRGLLPSKRRVLVLTDLPRLLCVKEYPDRIPGVTSNNPSSSTSVTGVGNSSGPTYTGDVVVKSEVLFSAATTRPQILSKISERSGENAPQSPIVEEDGGAQVDSSTEEAVVCAGAPRRRSSFALNSGAARPCANVIRGVEAKSDKSFVVRTTHKTYTYIAGDVASASQWLREIEEVRLSTQADVGLTVPPAA